jgi:hypothetical protein
MNMAFDVLNHVQNIWNQGSASYKFLDERFWRTPKPLDRLKCESKVKTMEE